MKEQKNSTDKLINVGLIGGGIWLGYLFLKKTFNEATEKNQGDKLGDDLPTQQAVALRTGFNPSGQPWLMGSDQTDEKIIFDTAAQIKDFSKVSRAYSNLYPGSILTKDLQNELDPTELKKFYDLLKNQEKEAVKKDTIKKQDFKFKVGQELASAPRPGMSRIPIYYDPKNNKGKLQRAYWHTVKNGYVGKNTEPMVIALPNKVFKRAYIISAVPAKGIAKDSKFLVFEEDIKLSVR